jgi:hypothetical protein
VESLRGTELRSAVSPHVVGKPAESIVSLSTMGTQWRGPTRDFFDRK